MHFSILSQVTQAQVDIPTYNYLVYLLNIHPSF